MSNVQDYIEGKKWKYKMVPSNKGIQFLIDHCPLCNSTDFSHFYISESGQFYCHKCGSKGTLLTLKESLGDLASIGSIKDLSTDKSEDQTIITIEEVLEANKNLFNSKVALRYLKHRMFSLEAIEYFKLGYSKENNQEWIWFPYLTDNIPVNVKKRSIDGKQFLRIRGGGSPLLNQDILKTDLSEVIIVEGEADCVALWSSGIKNVVGSTLGAQGIDPSWIDLLDRIPKILISYDMDDAGLEGAYKFANRLGLEKCFRVILPAGVKDANEFFQKGFNAEQFQLLMEQAKPFQVQHVTSIGEEIQKVISKLVSPTEKEETGLRLPWKKLDRLMDGMGAGDLICLVGLPGVGKSALALNLAYIYSMQDIPVLLFEMEMRPYRLMPGLAALHTGIDRKETMKVDIMQAVFRDLKDKPLLFARADKKPNFDFCADTIRKCYNRYGLRLVIFDNLHFLARSATDQTREVSVIVQNFKLLAEELGIPIMVIARPRKLSSKQKIITNQEIKDSADVEGDSDSIIIIHRDLKSDVTENIMQEEGIFVPETLLRVSKARWGPGGDCYMLMDDVHCRIVEE